MAGIEFPCMVEYAKSNRSTCKKCNRTIQKGELRIGKQYDRDHSGYHYYHLQCFPYRDADPEQYLFGWDSISASDQAEVRKHSGSSSTQASSALSSAHTATITNTHLLPTPKTATMVHPSPTTNLTDNVAQRLKVHQSSLVGRSNLSSEQYTWLLSKLATSSFLSDNDRRRIDRAVQAALELFEHNKDADDCANTLFRLYQLFYV